MLKKTGVLGQTEGFWAKLRMHSGVLQVARGGCGAEAPPLSARPIETEIVYTRQKIVFLQKFFPFFDLRPPQA